MTLAYLISTLALRMQVCQESTTIQIRLLLTDRSDPALALDMIVASTVCDVLKHDRRTISSCAHLVEGKRIFHVFSKGKLPNLSSEFPQFQAASA